ncbi:hypothetical protein A374_16048 [Fictibacillus macauensis ZFHKF-1]|uniref:Anti-sigma-W factor RsiW n=1 Tax=Fictibacillus macauensis ZFHKF-1 TaxID=1196324 RepID=I8AFZ9_9BACL|nr:anti-sigma factor [Fictibacillus macauensis]EIT84314.1 hypothetical protein A374_16048 [Fictibacillus macauensis ZFHKF-1]
MERKQCDQLLDYYNDQLTGEEKAAFEAHLHSCSDCQQEWQEWQALTEPLPYLSEDITPPASMKKRVLTNVFAESLDQKQEQPEQVTVLKPKPRRWLPSLLAAGLLLSLGANVYLYSTKQTNDQQAAPQEVSKTAQSVALGTVDQKEAGGTASFIQENQATNLVVQMGKMPKLSGTQTYQVWLVEGDKKYPAGSFVPNESGNGSLIYPIHYSSKHKWDAIAISLEPKPHNKQPKGKILMLSKL